MAETENEQPVPQEIEPETTTAAAAAAPEEVPKKKKKNPPLQTRSTAKSPTLNSSHIKGQDLKRRVRNSKFNEAIHKRGSQEVSGKPVEETDKPVVSPFALAILIFVVCGSAIFGVAQTLMG